MQAQTDFTARTFRSALVGLCRGDCGVYVEPYRRSEECPMDCERDEWRNPLERFRVLTKRRMLICSECTMSFPQNDLLGAEKHDCEY